MIATATATTAAAYLADDFSQQFFGRVALIDRDPAGYKKLCTHSIQASANPTLERLSLASAIEDAGGLRNDIEIFTRWGWIVAPSEQTIRRPAYGYNIRRSTLDPMLRKTAPQVVGVEFFPGVLGSRIEGRSRTNLRRIGARRRRRQAKC